MTFYLLALTVFMMQLLPLLVPSLLAVQVLVYSQVFPQYFSPCAACYSYRDVHDFVAQTGKPNYLVARVPVPSTLNISTWRGALLFSEQVTAYLTKEISLGRVAGPFDAVPFTDGFVVSPLNTVPKRDSAERRVIVDLSWPCGTSVNDGIPSDSFLGEPIPLLCPSLGLGCLLYKYDLKKAHRQFPVDPKDYHLLGYTWDNQFYFDTVLTLDLRSAAMACQ